MLHNSFHKVFVKQRTAYADLSKWKHNFVREFSQKQPPTERGYFPHLNGLLGVSYEHTQ